MFFFPLQFSFVEQKQGKIYVWYFRLWNLCDWDLRNWLESREKELRKNIWRLGLWNCENNNRRNEYSYKFVIEKFLQIYYALGKEWYYKEEKIGIDKYIFTYIYFHCMEVSWREVDLYINDCRSTTAFENMVKI